MIKILMAEDEIDVLEVMAKKVAAEGYQVVKTERGDEALELLRNEVPDIVLLDINLPGKDGFAVLKELRENPPSSKWIPVIIISARKTLEDMKRGFDLEADHYLTKPCTVQDVLKGIRLMEQLRHQRLKNSEG